MGQGDKAKSVFFFFAPAVSPRPSPVETAGMDNLESQPGHALPATADGRGCHRRQRLGAGAPDASASLSPTTPAAHEDGPCVLTMHTGQYLA